MENTIFRGAYYSSVTFEDSEEPLHIGGSVIFKTLSDKSNKIYIGRNILFKDPESYIRFDINSKDPSTTWPNEGPTIIIGSNVTEMGDNPIKFKLEHYSNMVKPKYLVCMGMTPPNFKSVLPHILEWRYETILVVPEGAEQAYSNHPIWKYFYIMLTHDVDEIYADKEVIREQWYTLDGRQLSRPEPGKINIRVSTYSDGTSSSNKVSIPQ